MPVSRAFTLIELLAVAAVIGLITTIVIISYSNRRLESPEQQAVLQFVSDLRQAQSMAMNVYDCNGIKTSYCLYNIVNNNYNMTCYNHDFELSYGVEGPGHVCFYPIDAENTVFRADDVDFIIGSTTIEINENGQITQTQ